MKTRWYKILLWIALSSGIIFVVFLALAVLLKPAVKTEDSVNKEIVLENISQIRLEYPMTINSKDFFEYFDRKTGCSEISTKWLINNTGEIIFAKGTTAMSTPLNTSIYSLAGNSDKALIDAVSTSLDTVQKELLYAAAAIRREGEHNDILGHLVIPLKAESGELAGFVGVAYNRDNSKATATTYIIIGVLIISFLLYWLSLPVWVYFDCRESSNNSIFWALFILFGNIPALVAYLIVTKK
jgi:hypothetical protein